jgi:hypothetical protein
MPSDENVSTKVTRWDNEANNDVTFNDIHAFINFRAKESYDEYHPSIGPCPSFEDRLLSWLNSTDNEKYQKIMFQFIPHIFYIGSEEFISLYIAALHEHIIPWIIDREGIDIASPDLNKIITRALKKVWFCPITDSMHIADFFHVNNIASNGNFRPDWFSLCKFGDHKIIREFMKEKGLEYLVLMEDFVGTGSQILGKGPSDIKHIEDGVIGFVGRFFKNIQTMILPLICCPKGDERLIDLEYKYNNVTFSPIITISTHMMVNSKTNSNIDSSEIFRDMSTILVDMQATYDWAYGPFGFLDTGSIIVMYSNCPNNTLPLIYQKRKNWSPLFPRSSRL